MTALRTGTTARIGLWAECFWGPVPGSMGLVGSSGMWTTGMTPTTDTMDRCRNVGRSNSIISMGTRRGTGVGMKGRLRTARRGSMRCRGITVAVAIRVDTTRPLLLSDAKTPRSQGRDPSTSLRAGSGAPDFVMMRGKAKADPSLRLPHFVGPQAAPLRMTLLGLCYPTLSTRSTDRMGHPGLWWCLPSRGGSLWLSGSGHRG